MGVHVESERKNSLEYLGHDNLKFGTWRKNCRKKGIQAGSWQYKTTQVFFNATIWWQSSAALWRRPEFKLQKLVEVLFIDGVFWSNIPSRYDNITLSNSADFDISWHNLCKLEMFY